MKNNRFAKVIASVLVIMTLICTAQTGISGVGISALAAEDDSFYYTVTAQNGLNLRRSPSTSSGILTVVPFGYTVCVTEVKETKHHIQFGKVSHDGKTGWIALPYAARHDGMDMVKSGLYVMHSAANTDIVVDTDGQRTAPGTPVRVCPPDDTDSQKIRLDYVGGGYYAIFMGCTDNMVLEADSSNDSQVKLAEHCGNDQQLWLIDKDGDYYRIISKQGYHLEITEGNTIEGTHVKVGSAKNDICQLWSFRTTELCKSEETGTGDEKDVSNSKTDVPDLKPDVPDFKQYDKRWGSVMIGSKSIRQVGCLVTSVSMLHSYTTGETIYPHQMKGKLKFANNDLIWESITRYGYNHTVYYKKVSSDLLCKIFDSLENGKPVVIGGRGRTSHWIIITGCSKTTRHDLQPKDFSINDPGSSKRDDLGDFLRDYPTIIATLS